MKSKTKRKRRRPSRVAPGALASRDFARSARTMEFILDAFPPTGSPTDTHARSALTRTLAAMPVHVRR